MNTAWLLPAAAALEVMTSPRFHSDLASPLLVAVSVLFLSGPASASASPPPRPGFWGRWLLLALARTPGVWFGYYGLDIIDDFGLLPAAAPRALVLLLKLAASFAIVAYTSGAALLLCRGLRLRLGPAGGDLGAAWDLALLPLATVAVELLQARLSPFGSWGSVAYTVHSAPALQVASLAGAAGVSFVVVLAGCFAAREIGAGSAPRAGSAAAPAAHRGTVAGALAALALWGGARTAAPFNAAVPNSCTFRATALMLPGSLDAAYKRQTGVLRSALASGGGNVNADAWSSFLTDYRAARVEMLAQTRLHASMPGTDAVVWPEAALLVPAEEHRALLDEAARIARATGATIGVSTAVLYRDRAMFSNNFVLVSPGEELLWNYNKTRTIPGYETPRSLFSGRQQDPLPVARLARSNCGGGAAGAIVLSPGICMDADFPATMATAGSGGADVLLVPSADWRASSPIHTYMARLRGIEQGISVVRAGRARRCCCCYCRSRCCCCCCCCCSWC